MEFTGKPVELTSELVTEFHKTIESEPTTILGINAASKCDPWDLIVKHESVCSLNHVFQYKVEEVKPVTNQKSTGTCWIYAALNMIRIPFLNSINVEEFEFSQHYLFFWDKIERCNFFLHSILEALKSGEKIEDRLISFLLKSPISDGGQWDMFVNLVTKYGLVPKNKYPASFSAQNSRRVDEVLRTKMHDYTKEIHDLLEKDPDADVRAFIKEKMQDIYRVISIFLGPPPTEFTWEYYDKNKAYHVVKNLTPLQFYTQHVKPVFNVEDKICLVNDPRKSSNYHKAYTVQFLGNVIGGRPLVYNNQPIDLLMKATGESIKEGHPVWFGCDVMQLYSKRLGLQDIKTFDFKSLFGIDVGLYLNKADRLVYGESAMTHAMNFTAVTFDDDMIPSRFRVENSWGEDCGEKGYLVLTADWFKEFVFEVVVDKKYVSQDILDVFKQEPIVLPAWDPLGSLARV